MGVTTAKAACTLVGVVAATLALPGHTHAADAALATPVERAAWFRLLATDTAEEEGACRVGWQSTPLNEAIDRLQEACGVAVWVDRRLDPGVPITTQPGLNVGEAVRSIASSIRTGATRIAGVYYLGPSAETMPTRLANRLDDLEQLPPKARRVFLKRDAVEWPRLTEPRALIEALLVGRGLSLSSAELIPHDRWAAFRLPAEPLADQLTLLLAGFDLDWQLEDGGRRVRVVAANEPRSVSAAHRAPEAARDAVEQLRRDLGTSADLRSRAQTLVLSGSVEQHRKLRQTLTRTPRRQQERARRTPRQQEQKYTLRVRNQPAAKVLRSLAEQVGFEVQHRQGAEAALAKATRISFETREASLDELLDRLAAAANVRIERQGATVVVTPKNGATDDTAQPTDR